MGNDLTKEEKKAMAVQKKVKYLRYGAGSSDQFLRAVLSKMNVKGYDDPKVVVHASQRAAILRMLKEDFTYQINSEYISPKDIDVNSEEIMAGLFEENCDFYIEDGTGSWSNPLNIFDCRRVLHKLQEMKDNPKASKKLYSGLEKLLIDLEQMSVVFDGYPDYFYRLVYKGEGEIKGLTKKYKGQVKDVTWFAHERGSYGYLWVDVVKGVTGDDKHKIYPSISEVVEGLYGFHCEQVERDIRRLEGEKLKEYHEQTQGVIDYYMYCLNLPNSDWPLTETTLRDPTSQEVQLILYLYSMEPPFSSELIFEMNLAARTLDRSRIQFFGALSRALYGVTNGGYAEQRRKDALPRGFDEKNESLADYGGMFMVFRGTVMNFDALESWYYKTGKEVLMHGNMSTTKSLDTALRYSMCNTYSGPDVSVLFVISIQNNMGFSGFRLNDEKYTAYPGEQVFLLGEGFPVNVLKVEQDVVIHNKNKSLKKFNNKKVTIIYLHNDSCF